MKTASILGVQFHAVTKQQAVELAMSKLRARQKGYVVTPNPEIVELCRRDPEFMGIVNHAALVLPDGTEKTVTGACEGVITSEVRGNGGFGYDPVFYYVPYCKTFAEASEEEKNAVSHRANAVRLIKKELLQLL